MDNDPRIWPFEPLRRAMVSDRDGPDGLVTDVELAALFGVSRDIIRKWRANGLRTYEADRVAIKRLRTHPGDVWGPAWYEAALAELPRADRANVAFHLLRTA